MIVMFAAATVAMGPLAAGGSEARRAFVPTRYSDSRMQGIGTGGTEFSRPLGFAQESLVAQKVGVRCRRRAVAPKRPAWRAV